ncbi:MAG TPA: DinB family protein [Candidatus Dormibacteraeota bacterium]|jgi:uncharacterized damage-inducible protein DinB|nr:DinB family protein [Candidatus Dormibacteraeota bacterium]
MSAGVSLIELIEFTDWERSMWHDWLRERSDKVLGISLGPHGDGRMQNIGDLVKHIFIAEKHHVERLSDRPLTDTNLIPNDSVEELFRFGQRSRKDLRDFVETHPAEDWEDSREFEIMGKIVSVTPRKFIVHILTHEIRHWAQIATMLRLNGLTGGFPDFLFSPVMSGGVRTLRV